MAASSRHCSRCLEPIADCICEHDEDGTPPDPFAIRFQPPHSPDGNEAA